MNTTNKLRLPVTKNWFEMQKSGIKTEDYREINEYWISRLTKCQIEPSKAKRELLSVGKTMSSYIASIVLKDFTGIPEHFFPKSFEENIVTLGYPKLDDSNKILRFTHKEIRIDYGKEEWGAVPGKLYFVIRHGRLINTNNSINNRLPQRFGNWHVSENGDMNFKNGRYQIFGYQLSQDNWILHMLEKDWVNLNEFVPAYFHALRNIGYENHTIKTSY